MTSELLNQIAIYAKSTRIAELRLATPLASIRVKQATSIIE